MGWVGLVGVVIVGVLFGRRLLSVPDVFSIGRAWVVVVVVACLFPNEERAVPCLVVESQID